MAWYVGNAGREALEYRGWFIGHFIDPSRGSQRISQAVEVKWGVHPAGEHRQAWNGDSTAHTMTLLISGRIVIDFPAGQAVLSEQGEYALWEPGTGHSWRAEEDSIAITVRWPSRAREP